MVIYSMNSITIGNKKLTIDKLVSVARSSINVHLSDEARNKINKTYGMVLKWIDEKKVIYGLSTGFGALSHVIISKKNLKKLQRNIILSHAAGVGNFMDKDIVRAMMLLKLNDFSMGHSGISIKTVETLEYILNAGIIPLIPEKGSVGASGDLVPLAHLALVLIGEGDACLNGKKLTGRQALLKCGKKPLVLDAAEGLSLLNGTQAMTAIGALAAHDADKLCKISDIAASMSLEVLMGSRTEFDPRIYKLRPHPGHGKAAANMLKITKNSEIISSHKDCTRVQDAYTLRCSPQVHGASIDAVNYVTGVIETEINSCTGNPLLFCETKEFLTGGNFHGQPIALAMDFLCIAVSEIGNISERRIERLVNPKLSGLPAFLVEDGGLNSGFMIAQYTAAALVSENKILSHPASVDSIPTSANKEDHVSMGTIAARKAKEIVKNSETILAIELLCAAQAIDLFTNKKPGEGTLAAYKTIRANVSHLHEDRILSKDIETVRNLILNGEIIQNTEKAVGPLNKS